MNHALASVPNRDIPERWRLPLANIARRCGLILLGLRLLAPALKASPSPEELAEYGVLLQKNGSAREALDTLEKIEGDRIPESLLYRAFCLFTRWDYAAARPLLERYVSLPQPDEYSRTIGLVNLASAHTALQDFPKAHRLLNELVVTCRARSYARLEGNCHELLAQGHIHGRDWSAAEAELGLAEKLLANDFSLDRFFVQKWSMVIAAFREADPVPLFELRRRAERLRHWESVREADLFLVKLTGDDDLFQRVYFGTPYASYRERLRGGCPGIEPADELILGSGPCRFDLSLSELDGAPVLSSGKKLHQMICLLFMDLYRPQRLAPLFAELFPEEKFNVFSSPNRVHQLLRRARRALREEGLPLEIVEDGGAYSIRLLAGLSVRLTHERRVVSPEHAHLLHLKSHFPALDFSAKEGRLKLGLPLTSFHRVLKYGIDKGLLTQRGRGPKTRYRAA